MLWWNEDIDNSITEESELFTLIHKNVIKKWIDWNEFLYSRGV
jgi:hypothetical protein